MKRCHGQATVETMLLVPIVALCALAGCQVLLVAWTVLAAGDAAHAGARAILSREPARAAVHRALPTGMRGGAAVEIDGDVIRVTVTSPSLIPGYAPRISEAADVVRQ